ncbi:MAG: glycosyltransferase [Proteobacteria bacterium]|nr:glycosyltransferase [Pseudomonadota bacterium]
MAQFVSVIIPVYNDPDRIGKCLNALAEQTWPRGSYEIIVADNGSTDETPRLLQDWRRKRPDMIRVVVENEIQSSYAARNKGVRTARGEIFAFTDSDCIPDPGWIESGVKAIEEENAACVGGRIEFFFKSERPNIYEHFDAGRKFNQRAFVEQSGFAATANFFVRRELIDQYGEFRDDLISGGDYEFGRRLTEADEKMIYSVSAMVKHPARDTLRAILKKTQRIAEGERQLQDLGLYERREISWRMLLPVKSSIVARGWKNRVSFFEKLFIMVLHNLVRWVNFFERIRRSG